MLVTGLNVVDIRANDTSDVWCPRGGKYREQPSLSFATSYIEEAQFDSVVAKPNRKPVVNLGFYSVTFNNQPQIDREALLAFKEFRAEARRKGFQYFLEVFAPNVDAGIRPEEVPFFVNDHICRMLAGVSLDDRPLFLKVPYFGPRALEELVTCDPTVIVGVKGGSSGTTLDAFELLADAQKYGARVALFGRKIKGAEDPLAFSHSCGGLWMAKSNRPKPSSVSCGVEAPENFSAPFARKRFNIRQHRNRLCSQPLKPQHEN